MDMDVLITVLIVVAMVFWEYIKIKRKLASEAQKVEARKAKKNIDEEDGNDEIFEENFVRKNEKIETDSPKSEPYFTYEMVSDQEVNNADTETFHSSESARIHLQEVENEIETDKLDLHNPEELKKAILYGEILKNTYN